MRGLWHKPPWYAGGLAFECIGCGRCCAGPEEGYVWISPEEIAAIAEYRGTTTDQVRRNYVRKVSQRESLLEQDGTRDCLFLSDGDGDGRCCRIYPVRPAQCRTWPFWPANLRDVDAWCRAALRCPGINRGTLHGLDEIQRRSRQSGS